MRKKLKMTSSGATTLIARGTHIIGDVQFEGCLEIEGQVTGNILAEAGTEARVRVLDAGLVRGELRVPTVLVSGTVEGDIHADKHIELAAKAVVEGNIHYSLLEIEKGAQVNGNFVRQGDVSASPSHGAGVAAVSAPADALGEPGRGG